MDEYKVKLSYCAPFDSLKREQILISADSAKQAAQRAKAKLTRREMLDTLFTHVVVDDVELIASQLSLWS